MRLPTVSPFRRASAPAIRSWETRIWQNPAAAFAGFAETMPGQSGLRDPASISDSSGNSVLTGSSFGKLSSQLGTPRQMQFALKYVW